MKSKEQKYQEAVARNLENINLKKYRNAKGEYNLLTTAHALGIKQSDQASLENLKLLLEAK